jgi:hypothetical protein
MNLELIHLNNYHLSYNQKSSLLRISYYMLFKIIDVITIQIWKSVFIYNNMHYATNNRISIIPIGNVTVTNTIPKIYEVVLPPSPYFVLSPPSKVNNPVVLTAPSMTH